MKKRKKLSRVDVQVWIMTAIAVVASCGLIFFLNYSLSYNDMIDTLRERSQGIYDYLEQYLDKDSFLYLNSAEDMQKEEYTSTKSMLESAKNTAGVRYLYTAKRTADGEYIYLVDGLPSNSGDFRNAGDLLEPEIIPDIERAYQNQVVMPEEIKDTSWGYVFVTYFPIHHEGEVVGVVGIEFDAAHQYVTFRLLKIVTPIVIILCCIISGIVAAILFKHISNPAYRDLANTDILTGLNNRNSFDVIVNNLEALAGKQTIGFIVADLDGLKNINDLLGHAAGDLYIRTGSNILQNLVAYPDVLYRIGGDEFAVILRGKNPDQVRVLVSAMKDAVEKYALENNTKLSFSFGYALFSADQDQTLGDTLKRADAAMYDMKRKRKAMGPKS